MKHAKTWTTPAIRHHEKHQGCFSFFSKIFHRSHRVDNQSEVKHHTKLNHH